MPPAEVTQRSLTGAWRMMTGRPGGLKLLDLSVDGFWDSFYAIVVALPALAVGWVAAANDVALVGDEVPDKLSFVLRFAVVDLGSWIIPIGLLAFVVRPAGIADRFVPYVVASNWASVIVIWIMLPPQLLRMVLPGAQDLVTLLSLGLFLTTLFLTWRVTNAAVGKGPAVATSVFFGMFAASLAVLFALQLLLGLDAG